ncbi:phage tail assembly protein [Rhodobacter sphaeroides]|jgi:Phage tail protein E.|uniref:Phage related tail protein n=1 Tax=Cereibacter sphaeroides (strain ATCC 17023 / DSM 158 / JCM 6121 / CCUG 31486 / LMG 2827 / NBRC 12203 / NCIMB 8253 / ATH 2.4.1.) TaxID=272943 RepID=Q3IWX6_CERS4|nr:phage tail assembly protein [Cereibacter sphaeroides]ABA80958.1 Phage related tail protein [Cereibacter sphaeroides 2.4.1]ANS35987.1 phage tail protein [Cereibacter sphaeroides]ATN65051.1 phage tail protein [Cereibacter sphaeroides]AXC63253.1 phage tail assembly protein [Cereibacter sphaeroides 2.4.1]MVX49660.1 phage tail assembly protein [Cereibacter sphaeroides]
MSKTTLLQPLKRASGDIASVTVRKPDVGSLRGLKLTDILQMDVTALSRLLPRITEPALLPDEVAALDPADFLGLSAAVVGFFATAEMVATAEADLLRH